MWGSFVPDSKLVQTLEELQKPWTDRLAAFNNRDPSQSPAPGASQRANFNNMLVERFAGTPNVDHTNIGAIGDAYWNSALSAASGGYDAGADKFFSDPKTFNFRDLVSSVADDQFDWAGYEKGMKEVADPFNAALDRQTKAYGQMQGGNYFGGMMDERYSQPFGGQMQRGTQANGDPTSGSGAAASGVSSFGESFGRRPNQYRAGAWGGYGW